MRWYFLALAALSFLVASCGEKWGQPPTYDKSIVSYQIDANGCFLSAEGYDFINDYYTSYGTHFIQVTWMCTEYKGREDVYVEVTFNNTGGTGECLEFRYEHISDGLCK